MYPERRWDSLGRGQGQRQRREGKSCLWGGGAGERGEAGRNDAGKSSKRGRAAGAQERRGKRSRRHGRGRRHSQFVCGFWAPGSRTCGVGLFVVWPGCGGSQGGGRNWALTAPLGGIYSYIFHPCTRRHASSSRLASLHLTPRTHPAPRRAKPSQFHPPLQLPPPLPRSQIPLPPSLIFVAPASASGQLPRRRAAVSPSSCLTARVLARTWPPCSCQGFSPLQFAHYRSGSLLCPEFWRLLAFSWA